MKTFKDHDTEKLITLINEIKQMRYYSLKLNPFEITIIGFLHFDSYGESYNILSDGLEDLQMIPCGEQDPVAPLLEAYNSPELLFETIKYGYSKERRSYFKELEKTYAITVKEAFSGPLANYKIPFSMEGYEPRMIDSVVSTIEISWMISQYKNAINNDEIDSIRKIYFKQRLDYFEGVFASKSSDEPSLPGTVKTNETLLALSHQKI